MESSKESLSKGGSAVLTGVYPDPDRRRIGGTWWIAVWRLDLTTGRQFIHHHLENPHATREEALEAAEREIPEVVARVKAAA